uniref:Microprocessor complex subunit DGCR8 n=1 Tax=Parascaris univalens TaxID=6257 RepID=A0A915BWX8_PARUN
MDVPLTEDTDIEQLLAMRRALMIQLGEAECNSLTRPKSVCPFRNNRVHRLTDEQTDSAGSDRSANHLNELKGDSKFSDGNDAAGGRPHEIRPRIERSGEKKARRSKGVLDLRKHFDYHDESSGYEATIERKQVEDASSSAGTCRESISPIAANGETSTLRDEDTTSSHRTTELSCEETVVSCDTKTHSPQQQRILEISTEKQSMLDGIVSVPEITYDSNKRRRNADDEKDDEQPIAKCSRIEEKSNADDNITERHVFSLERSTDSLPASEGATNTSTNDAREEHFEVSEEMKEHRVDYDGLECSILPPPPPPPPLFESCSLQSDEIIPPPPMPPLEDFLHSTSQEEEVKEKSEEANGSWMKESIEDVSVSDDACEENIDSLLEKPFKDGQTGKMPIPDEGEMREKIVLAHRGVDYFDVLPEGWLELTHTSGLPVYLHKATRVCTFSRPYFIGPSSVRHHSVPESAIPCLHQRRVLKEVEECAKASADALQSALDTTANTNGETVENDEDKAKLIATLQAPNTKVQTAKDFKEHQLDPQALHEYAKKVFRFKTIQVYRFQKWSATRSFHRQKKLAEAERLGKLTPSIEVPIGRPTLPGNVKLITVPSMEANLKPQHKGFFLNPQGKTSISILHEYVQKVLKSTINYQFTETRSSSTPYGCSARLKMNLNNRVMSATSIKEKLMLLQEKQRREQQLQQNGEPIDSEFVVLGSGYGNSKKTAKLDAARSALKVLIPAIDFDAEGIAVNQKNEGEAAEKEQEDAVALFDMLPIEDSRIPDLSLRAGQPSPYLLLQECLKRNAAYGDTEIKLSSERVRHQKHQFDMDVGKHRVSVECCNKREGKQKASQAMLKKLHPNLDTWGSLIRLYGHEAQQKQQEAKRSQRSIIKLQGSRDKEGSSMEPNMAILERLCAGMLNIQNSKRRRQEAKGEPLTIRSQLSTTNDIIDGDAAAVQSDGYAVSHPDALSAFRIDL